ncbi:HAD family phosphatase [bacterium 1XD42-1]|nr:HAD family phosphatase [bacterium 1XD42-8]RKJ66950.1 HAD family phosphatase [bacterium 1XD42-1]
MMIKKLSSLWIFSDIDGTMVEAPNPIPRRNLEALQRFTENGGHFAISTGRTVEAALQYANDLPVNVPSIIFNGGAIYDFAKKKMLYAKYLSRTWRDYTKAVLEHFPDVGITLMGEGLYIAAGNYASVKKYLVDIDHVVPVQGTIDGTPGELIKIIFVAEEKDTPALAKFLSQIASREMVVSRSSPNFVELLPFEVDKGTCLKEYSRLFQIPMENMIAIGDYFNDEAMLRTAGYPVTVAGAPEELKSLCHYVTGPCMEGALADLVIHLESLCGIPSPSYC